MATLKDQTEISAKIRTPGEQIAAFCRRHQIRWLALFGSVLRDDFRTVVEVQAHAGGDLLQYSRELWILDGRLHTYAPE